MDHKEQPTIPVSEVMGQLLDLYAEIAKKSGTIEQIFGSRDFLSEVEDRMDHLILDIAGVPKDETPMPESFGFDHFVRDTYLDVPWGYLAGRVTKEEVVTLLVNWEKFDELADLWAKLDNHRSDQVD